MLSIPGQGLQRLMLPMQTIDWPLPDAWHFHNERMATRASKRWHMRDAWHRRRVTSARNDFCTTHAEAEGLVRRCFS